MASLNRIILIGRLTADPETRTTLEGIPITKFSLGVERRGSLSAQKQTDIIDVIAWRSLAEICGKFLKKGNTALVEGRIQTRTYDTKEGIKKYVTEVVSRDVVFLDKTKGTDKSQDAANSAPKQENEFLEEDLPF